MNGGSDKCEKYYKGLLDGSVKDLNGILKLKNENGKNEITKKIQPNK